MAEDLDFKEFEKDLHLAVGSDVLFELTSGHPIIRAYRTTDPSNGKPYADKIYFYTKGYLHYVSSDFRVEVYRLGNGVEKFLSVRFYDGNPERCSYYAWNFVADGKQMYSDMLPVEDGFVKKWFPVKFLSMEMAEPKAKIGSLIQRLWHFENRLGADNMSEYLPEIKGIYQDALALKHDIEDMGVEE